MDVREYVFARSGIRIAVALQYLAVFERIFHRHERHVRFFSHADEEDEGFFADEFLVVIHSADTVVQHFSFADEVGGGMGDDTDEGAAFVVLQGQVFFRDDGELFVKDLFRLSVRLRFCRGVLVRADVVPAFEVVRKTVFRQGHVDAEMITGFEIIEICIDVGVLFGNVFEEPFLFFPFEKFADRGERTVIPQVDFRFAVRLQCFERFSRLISAENDVHVIVLP